MFGRLHLHNPPHRRQKNRKWTHLLHNTGTQKHRHEVHETDTIPEPNPVTEQNLPPQDVTTADTVSVDHTTKGRARTRAPDAARAQPRPKSASARAYAADAPDATPSGTEGRSVQNASYVNHRPETAEPQKRALSAEPRRRADIAVPKQPLFPIPLGPSLYRPPSAREKATKYDQDRKGPVPLPHQTVYSPGFGEAITTTRPEENKKNTAQLEKISNVVTIQKSKLDDKLKKAKTKRQNAAAEDVRPTLPDFQRGVDNLVDRMKKMTQENNTDTDSTYVAEVTGKQVAPAVQGAAEAKLEQDDKPNTATGTTTSTGSAKSPIPSKNQLVSMRQRLKPIGTPKSNPGNLKTHDTGNILKTRLNQMRGGIAGDEEEIYLDSDDEE